MRKYHPDATIFFNSGGTNMQLEELHQFQARFEMEPLPTVWVGYGVLPVQAKYFSRTGARFCGHRNTQTTNTTSPCPLSWCWNTEKQGLSGAGLAETEVLYA